MRKRSKIRNGNLKLSIINYRISGGYLDNFYIEMNWTSKEYKCSEKGCDRIFNTKWILKRHLTIHQIENIIYKCNECDKKFLRKDSLDRHRKISHSSVIMMYVCSENDCGKFFNLKSTLHRHMCSHTGIFECEDCGRSFTRKDNLARHKLVHANHLSNNQIQPVPFKNETQNHSMPTKHTDNLRTNHKIDFNDGKGDHTYSV